MKTNLFKQLADINLSEYSFLITGGAGFIGSNITQFLLAKGVKKVTILDNLSTGHFKNLSPFTKHNNFQFIEGDITNLKTCELATQNVDFVLHQAALGSVPRSFKDPLATNNNNVVGFLNIISASKKSKVKKIVFASSSAVYGDSKELPKIETKTGNLLSPYAVSKHTKETYAKVLSEYYSIPIIGLRYFNVFGPNQDPNGAYAAVIPRWIDSILKNKTLQLNGDGSTSRDFTYVDNIILANILSCIKTLDKDYNVFNVGCGDQINLKDLLNILIKNIDIDFNKIEYNNFRKGDVKHSNANIELIKNKLSYSPLINFETGIKKTIEYYEKNTFAKD